MVVTVSSTAAHDLTGEIKVQLGAFPFTNIDASVPIVPVLTEDSNAMEIMADSSIKLMLSVGLAVSALSLF
jgi:hypothetical protein